MKEKRQGTYRFERIQETSTKCNICTLFESRFEQTNFKNIFWRQKGRFKCGLLEVIKELLLILLGMIMISLKVHIY